MTTTIDARPSGTLLTVASSADALSTDGGGKAAHLHRMSSLGYPVPTWCCIPATEFDRFVEVSRVTDLLARDDGRAAPGSSAALGDDETLAAAIERRLLATPIPDDLRQRIREELARLGLADRFTAVRSSGVGEDSAEHSFAGQFSSFLFQRGEDQVHDAIRRCWASAWSARNIAYRRAAGLSGSAIRMGVVIQQMVDAGSAGVAFSRNPLRCTDRRTVVVESVRGQGEGLVSGVFDADHFDVDRDTLEITSRIAEKTRALVQDPRGGLREIRLPDAESRLPSLTDQQVREVATMVLRLERDLGRPQDCEWALAGDRIFCLQTRPITTLPPDGLFDNSIGGDDPIIWDNSNIIESFAGVTTPLTFTHVNRCYREVYLQFCRVMGVPEETIADHEPVFRTMLGLIRGRVYYNLVSWYRLLGLFPAVGHSRGFMETMMGVQQSLTPELAALFEPLRHPPRYSPWRRAGVLLTTVYRLARARRYVDEFMDRMRRVYGPLEQADLRTQSLAGQLALYRRLEVEILQHWTAPIVNDTRCMVAFGILGALTTRWVQEAADRDPGHRTPANAVPSSLRNDLLCGEGDLKSTEPTRVLMRIANGIDNGDRAVRERFLAESPDVVWTSLQDGFAPELRASFDDFLRDYGFRCVNELKLEEPDLHDDPRFVISSVQAYVRMRTYSVEAMSKHEADIRHAAESRVRRVVRGPKRWIYFRVLRWARRAVSDRELLRFERTRTFGVSRRLFRGVGANLVRMGMIDAEHDVFYLTLDELLGLNEGRAVTTDLRSLVRVRQGEFAEYRRTVALPDRFLTRGSAGIASRYPMLLLENDLLVDARAGPDDPNLLRGTPCSPGIVEGVVRVAERLRDAEGIDGDILVTERTDPGWVPIFPSCAGLIIERGSLLSHSAVVARELGIPTVVGVSGRPMQRLKTGMRVRLDAGAGEIRIL